MTTFALSPVKCDASGDLLERVQVIQADTLSLVQGGMTAGSTTSEASCEVVRICCNELVEGLTPLKERLQEKMGPISWNMLILQIEGAFEQGISFFMLEEYFSNSDGLVILEGTFSYKITTIDTIPKQFNVEILNSGHHQRRVLSSKVGMEA